MRNICDTELNVELYEEFYSRNEADILLDELSNYDFKNISFEINGTQYVPRRKVLGFGDEGLSYEFSGTSICAEPWTQTLLNVKDYVETITGKKYNFALLNYYPDGVAKISTHKDNETCLEPESDIPIISLGAKRQMVFTRRNFTSRSVDLTHGTLLVMKPPTNQFWMHGIPSQPDVKDPRISITFRNIKISKIKKRRLEDNEDELPEDDWFAHYMKSVPENIFMPNNREQKKESSKLIAQWTLGWGYFVSINQFENRMNIHLRECVEQNKILYPTTRGVVITPATWQEFSSKIYEFNLVYTTASIICNNELVVFNKEGECIFQQVFKQDENSFKLKPTYLKVNCDILKKLKEIIPDVSNTLYKSIFEIILPLQIKCKNNCSDMVSDDDELFKELINSIKTELNSVITKLFKCEGCIVNHPSQTRHDCIIISVEDRIKYIGEDIFLCINFKNIRDSLRQKKMFHLFCNRFFESKCYEDYKNALI